MHYSLTDFINRHLNVVDNIPPEYRGKIYKKWYCDSFREAVLRELVPPNMCDTKRRIENALQHILSRLFQFLYISVYRETTFDEIFTNADEQRFLEAVGITKDDFSKLRDQDVFRVERLDAIVNKFFGSESLGRPLSNNPDAARDARKYYRNSFEWFGYGVE